MSALPTKAGMRLAVQKCPLSAISRHLRTSFHWLHIAVPPFGTGFVLLVLGYLVLLAGNDRNGGVGFSNANIVDARR